MKTIQKETAGRKRAMSIADEDYGQKRYILNKRLELAKQLLQMGQLSVTQVAMHCNFPDVYTFSKAFKKHFNITPSGFLAVCR